MERRNCFEFLPSPARTKKPRKRGLTICSDTGLSLVEAQSLIEAAGDVIDHVKYVEHVGTLWRCTPAQIKKKNAFYEEMGIETLPGGVPFQVAVVHGKVPEYMRRVAELGFRAVEVSADTIDPLSPQQRTAAIRWGKACGLAVYTELGRKFPDRPLDADESVDWFRRDTADGAAFVVVEKGDITNVIREKLDTLHQIVSAVGLDRLIFEPGPGDDVFDNAAWLLNEFGSDVNLENLHPYTIMPIEGMRHQLHRKVGHRYFKQFEGKTLPRIPDPG